MVNRVISMFRGHPNKVVDTEKSNRHWAYVIGLGMALTPIHNLWLTNLSTNSKGETLFFLPAFGTAIWLIATLWFLLDSWKKGSDWKEWLGDWRIFVPLLIIVLFMGISGLVTGKTLGGKFAPLFMGVSLFAVYVAARRLGAILFRALIPFVILGAVVAVVLGILHPGLPTSQVAGLITNYAANAGFLIFGAVVNQGKWQWVLVAIALVGVFFIGALEAAFIVTVLGITVIARRDFSRRFLTVAGIAVGLVGLWALLGYLVPLYKGNNNLNVLFNLNTPDALNNLTTDRWGVILNSLRDIRFFGHGYTLNVGTQIVGNTVHNIPLIIVYQIGPIAGLAWLLVSIFCLTGTKWKYAWIALLAMCVFDHYFWTQLYPLWWCLIGVSCTSSIKNDLIFREAKANVT